MTQAPENTSEDGSGRSNRLTDEEFAEACALYESGDMGVVEIADKFGVSRQALSQRFRNNGIVKGAKVQRQAEPEPPPETYAGRRAGWIEETRMQGYSALRTASMLARKIVQDQVKIGGRMEDIEGDLRAVQRYNKILCDNLAATLDLLDAENYASDEELGILEISDLTEEEILAHHKGTGALSEDATIEDLIQAQSIEVDL